MKKAILNIKTLALIAFAGMGLASCGDFLEIEPKTFVSEDNFWNEKTDIDQMVAGTYLKMQDAEFMRRLIIWGEVRSDNIVEGLDASKSTDFYRVLKENLLSTNSYSKWITFYSVINECNTIIEEAPMVSEKDPTYTQSDVLATQAEMAALRDLCYFYLVRTYEDVPYYTYAITSEAEVAPIGATNGDSIVRCLIADLEERAPQALKAYPKDNASNYNSNRNRVTQNMIYSLLADLCLWNGDYQKCVTYAQKVIDSKYDEYKEDYSNTVNIGSSSPVLFKSSNDSYSKGYPLYPCYSGNTYGNDFTNIFGGNQCSFESIFELGFTYDGNNSNLIANSAFASLFGNDYTSGGNSGKGLMGVNENIIADVSNKKYSIFDHQYDVRYYENIYNPTFESNGFTTGYCAKYCKDGVTIQQSQGSSTLPFTPTLKTTTIANRNFIFYRLTDVMLMQAEALIELGSEVQKFDADGNVSSTSLDDNLKRAFYLIWTVNRRSIMTNSATAASTYELDINKYSTKAQLQDLCIKERRREFMFEGKRWFDLLRLCHRDGTTTPIRSRVSSKGSSGSSANLFMNPESLYWPYNKDELKNNSALSQKSYYGDDGEDDD